MKKGETRQPYLWPGVMPGGKPLEITACHSLAGDAAFWQRWHDMLLAETTAKRSALERAGLLREHSDYIVISCDGEHSQIEVAVAEENQKRFREAKARMMKYASSCSLSAQPNDLMRSHFMLHAAEKKCGHLRGEHTDFIGKQWSQVYVLCL